MSYIPEHLVKWSWPDSYCGAEWTDYYSAGFGQSRDSDALERSNFETALKCLGGETDTVLVVHEGHWAVGWVEWIAIHKSDAKALEEADSLVCAVADYPVLDDEHFSELERVEADEVWQHCYSVAERLDHIRQHRSEFDFRDYQDLIGCVRGNYYAGYASSILHS